MKKQKQKQIINKTKRKKNVVFDRFNIHLKHKKKAKSGKHVIVFLLLNDPLYEQFHCFWIALTVFSSPFIIILFSSVHYIKYMLLLFFERALLLIMPTLFVVYYYFNVDWMTLNYSFHAFHQFVTITQ